MTHTDRLSVTAYRVLEVLAAVDPDRYPDGITSARLAMRLGSTNPRSGAASAARTARNLMDAGYVVQNASDENAPLWQITPAGRQRVSS
jgi:hypothetical protein